MLFIVGELRLIPGFSHNVIFGNGYRIPTLRDRKRGDKFITCHNLSPATLPVVICRVILHLMSHTVAAYDYEPQPDKASLMVIHAHPDAEGIFLGLSVI